MGRQLNIKGGEAYVIAAELAGLTGESMTAAVVEAVRLKLEQERKKRDLEQLLKDVRATTADIRANMGHPLPMSDHSWLHDEDGLPA